MATKGSIDSDDQELMLNGTILSIEGGNSIDLGPILGSGGTTQTLGYATGMLSISGGNTLDLSTCPATDVFGNFIGYLLP